MSADIASVNIDKLREEIKALRNEIARLNSQTNWVCTCGGTDTEGQKELEEQAVLLGKGAEREARLLGRIGELQQENAALRKDKERLDFWNANHDVRIGHSNKLCGSGINSPGWWWQLGRLHEHGGIKNIRDTLDSAIAWHKKPRGPKAGIHINEEGKQ